jgi:histidyl-tRNA synthetase
MGDAAKAFGLKLCRELRSKGLAAEMDTLARNIKGQFKYADRLNAKYTLVIGENELEKGVVSLKDMAKSAQREVKIEDIFEEISK